MTTGPRPQDASAPEVSPVPGLRRFVARSARQAAARIRAELGPSAVVVEVRPIRPRGFRKWWVREELEVLVRVPAPVGGSVPSAAPAQSQGADSDTPVPQETSAQNLDEPAGGLLGHLVQEGLDLPVARALVDEVLRAGGDPSSGLAGNRLPLRNILRSRCPMPDTGKEQRHVFVGASGVGKSTLAGKWMAHAALVEGRRVELWRLDGPTANTAAWLGVCATALGVPERRVPASGLRDQPGDLVIIDVPGTDWRDRDSLEALKAQVGRWGPVRVHVVVDLAYDSEIQRRQVKAFAEVLPVTVALSHLDEEPRRGRIWNLVLGTKCSVSFLSAGQNIPAGLVRPTPEALVAAWLP